MRCRPSTSASTRLAQSRPAERAAEQHRGEAGAVEVKVGVERLEGDGDGRVAEEGRGGGEQRGQIDGPQQDLLGLDAASFAFLGIVAWRAGAAIVHLHVRNEQGKVTGDGPFSWASVCSLASALSILDGPEPWSLSCLADSRDL